MLDSLFSFAIGFAVALALVALLLWGLVKFMNFAMSQPRFWTITFGKMSKVQAEMIWEKATVRLLGTSDIAILQWQVGRLANGEDPSWPPQKSSGAEVTPITGTMQ